MPSRVISAIKQFLANFWPGFENYLSVWIAPRYCVIAEFRFGRKGSVSALWSEQIPFAEYSDLHDSVRKLVQKRLLNGCPVTVSLSTAEVFAKQVEPDWLLDIEAHEVLPPGISWDSVDYSIKNGPVPLVACIRHADVDFWANFFREIGLVAGTVVPSGLFWPQFVEGPGDIMLSTPSGTFVRNCGDGKVAACFVPETVVDAKKEISFNLPLKPEYRWCPSFLAPALEGVISFREEPLFNLNPYCYSADKLFKTERTFRSFSLRMVAGFAGLAIAVLLVHAGLDLWWAHDSRTRGLSNALSVAKEEERIKDRLASLRNLAATRVTISKLMHDIGSLPKDSIWYSELSVSLDNGVQMAIIGHSLSESAVANVLAGAEAIPGVKTARLEYTEKVPGDEVARLTAGKRRKALFRYKLILAL